MFSGNDITVGQLEDALIALRGTSLESKYHSLFSVLDEDHDGNIKLEEIVEVNIHIILASVRHFGYFV
jgi:Ca2+-binding EF-hand superfamily protein